MKIKQIYKCVDNVSQNSLLNVYLDIILVFYFFTPTDHGDISIDHGEKFSQDIYEMKLKHQGSFNPNIIR